MSGYKVAWGPISNRATWHEQIRLTETEGGTAPTVTEAVLTFGGGRCSEITKRLSEDGLTYEDGVLSWSIAETTMDDFSAGTYPMGCVLTIAGVQEQLFYGDLEIYDGIVP